MNEYNKIYISIIIILIAVVVFLLFTTNNKKTIFKKEIIFDTTYVYLPADTVKLTQIKTHKIYVRDFENIDSITSIKLRTFTREIDSLNNELTKYDITRIAELDTVINPYLDRLNIQYFINRNLWNIDMYYNRREIKVAEKIIYLKEDKKQTDFEKIISENPYLTIILSTIVGYGIGKTL